MTKREEAMAAVRRAVNLTGDGRQWQNRAADIAADAIRFLPHGTFADEVDPDDGSRHADLTDSEIGQ